VRNIESSMRSFLTDTFGPRATFDEMERKVYGHDIGSIPSMIKPFLGRTAPDAVVQPETTEELSKLAARARDMKVPL